jgi:hypothetical protein
MHVDTKTIFNITIPLGFFWPPQPFLKPQLLLSTKTNYIKIECQIHAIYIIARDSSKRFFHYINNEVTQT